MRGAAARAKPTAVTHDLSLACTDLAPARAGRVVAEGVSFSLSPGGALVLRGANGSGKTSVLRAVAGLASYGGRVAFAEGAAPADPGEVRARRVHLLAAGEGLADRLTAAETLAFWVGLHGADAAGILARVGLSEAETTPAGRLSAGQRRRLGLARLLLAPRALWLLDEPLSGLDEGGRALLLDAVATHRAEGGIVLMATHEADGLPGAPVLRLS